MRPRSSTARVSTLRRADTARSLPGGSRHGEPAAPGGRSISSCSGSTGSGSATTTDGASFFLARRRGFFSAAPSASWSYRDGGDRSSGEASSGGVVTHAEQVRHPRAGPGQRGAGGVRHQVPQLADRPAGQQADGQHPQDHQDREGAPPTQEPRQCTAHRGAQEAAGVREGVHAVLRDGGPLTQEDVQDTGHHQQRQPRTHGPQEGRVPRLGPGLLVLLGRLGEVDGRDPARAPDEQHAAGDQGRGHQDVQASDQAGDPGGQARAHRTPGEAVHAQSGQDGEHDQDQAPDVVAVAVEQLSER